MFKQLNPILPVKEILKEINGLADEMAGLSNLELKNKTQEFKERLAQDDIKEKGFLLDGFPRTIEQAHSLDQILVDLGLELDGVINIEVDPSCLLERLSGRIIHRETGETYHKVFNPPADYKEEDYYQREDDKPETVKRRLDVNIAQGEPIIAHYRELGLVSDIQGNQDIDDVFADVKKAIAAIK